MEFQKKLSAEAVLLALITLLGWAATFGMLIQHERDNEKRVDQIEKQLCVLLARGKMPAGACKADP